MTIRRTTALIAPVCCAVTVGACGGDDEPTPSAAAPAAETSEAAPEEGSAGGETCEDVTVPGHEAVDVRATGAACGAAEKVAAAAEGRGRAPYEAGGFACTPSDASGGNTSYSCSMGSARVTFLYGTT